MTRRVLIVVSSYRPAMLADMQRARMLAWELPALGWNVEILAPSCHEVRQDAVDNDSAAFFAPKTEVHEIATSARVRRWLARLGARALVWRTWWPMHRLGRALLQSGRFDLVMFSTATFGFFLLGALWRRRNGIPYVLDFHDPWLIAHVPERDDSWPARQLRRFSSWTEHVAVGNAAGLIAVSPHYLDDLRARFGAENPAWTRPGRNAVIPIGASKRDLAEAVKAFRPRHREESDDLAICYIGAGGPVMLRSFTLICRALALLRARNDALAARARLRLYGTIYGWTPGEPRPFELAAGKAGVGDQVVERPERVSYRHALELLLESDGALILGVDDPGYMPSKLFAYALAGKPMLASLRGDGPAFAQFRAIPKLGHALWFDDAGEMPLAEAAEIVRAFLQEAAAGRNFDRDALIEAHLAPAMARRHVELFEACLRP